MALLSELVHCASLCIVRVCAQYCQRFGPWYFHSSHDNMMTNRKKWSCSVCWKTCGGGQRSGMYRRAAKWHLVTLDAALQQSQRANRVYSVQIARLILIQMRMRVMAMMVVVWWFEDMWMFCFDLITVFVPFCPLAASGEQTWCGSRKIGSTAAPTDAIRSIFLSCGAREAVPQNAILVPRRMEDARKENTSELDGWRLEGCTWLVLCNGQWSSSHAGDV